MGALTDNTIADTYKQLLKITSEGVNADASAKYVEDGLGTDTALSLSTTRIGIGTASPGEVVHIKNANAAIKYESTAGSGYTWNTGNIVTNGNFTFSSNSTNNVLTLTNGGKVGIQTSSPSVGGWSDKRGTLTISSTDESDANNYAVLELQGHSFNSSGINGIMMFLDHTVELARIQSNSLGSNQGDIKFSTNNGSSNAVKMTIIPNGNVGINETSPTAKLDVDGDIQIKGANALLLNHTTGAASNTYINSPADDVIAFRTGGTERGRFDDQGNFGIGASGSNLNARIVRGFSANKGLVIETAQPAIQLVDTDNTGRYFTMAYEQSAKTVYMHNQSNGPIRFDTNEVPRMEITGAGYLKAGNLLHDDYSNYDASAVLADTDHALVNRENSSYVLRCWQTHASNPYGIIVKYVNADVSNTSNHFFVGAEDNQDRFQLRSNGGLANVQSNNADLSDERAKKEITDVSSQYNFIKSLKVKNFKYKEDTDEDRVKTGIIAQEVETLDASLVDNTGSYVSKHIKESENAKLVYDKDIHYRTIKALQEAMNKIETLESKGKALSKELQDTKDYVDHKQDYNSMAGRINSCEARIASLEKE